MSRFLCPQCDYVEKAFGSEKFKAFLPESLPIKNISIDELRPILDKANVALGRLDGASSILPDINLFLYMYVKKEAVLSSQIEGTQSSLSDLLLYESGESSPENVDDIVEVSSYVRAINYALTRIQTLPLSLRLIKETHEILLCHSRGKNKSPGEFRKSQNWIGGSSPSNAIYVPPPVEYLDNYLSNFESFLYNLNYPALIKIAICHAQFESIHPFLDGNGRMGRLLITLMLCTENIIQKPVVYLSLFFKEHKDVYFDLLQKVRTKKDWHSWIEFFLKGIVHVCDNAVDVTNQIFSLFTEDREKIFRYKSCTINLLGVYDALKLMPISSVSQIAMKKKLSEKTVLRMLRCLEDLGIVRETTGQQRNLKYSYDRYLSIFLK